MRHYVQLTEVVEQGMRRFGYYPPRNGRTRRKFVDRAESRKSLHQPSSCKNELFDVLHHSKYSIAANNYDMRQTVDVEPERL